MSVSRCALVLGLLLCGPSAVRAEDWGLTREPPPARPRTQRPQRVRPPTGAATGENAGRSAREVLRERYLRLLLNDPLHAFALDRLLAIHRERDGNLDVLASELAARAARGGGGAGLLLLIGQVEAARGEGDAARAAYAKAAELAPSSPGPLLLRAALQREAGELERAAESLEQALARTDAASARADVLRDLGELALEREDFAAAERHYAALAAAGPKSVNQVAEYARALAAHGHHERAAVAYAAAMDALRGDNRVLPPLLLELAQVQLEAGDADAALASLERARKFADSGTGVRYAIDEAMVEAYRRTGRLAQLAERLAREPGRGFAQNELLGRIYDELGDHARALEALRRALAQNSRHIESRTRVIQILSRQGEIDAVIDEYRSLVRVAPREPRFVVELAKLLLESGKRGEALALLDRTASRHRNDARIHRALFEIYARWKEPARARAALEHLTRIEPEDPTHLMALGEHLLGQGEEAKALAVWRNILNAGDDKASAHAALGSVLLDHDMPERALAQYEAAVEFAPQQVEYVRGLADTLERLQRTGAAAARWEQVLSLSQDRAQRREARRRVVRLWAASGDLEGKIAGFERAFERDEQGAPPDPEAGRFLAEAYRLLSVGRGRVPGDSAKLEAAERVLARVIAIDPGDLESLLSLERLRTARGELDGAIAVLEKLIEADPKHAQSYLARMAEHALAAYRDADAVAYAERLTQLNPQDPRAHERLGDLYRARQNTAGAIASYERAVELDQSAFQVMLQLSELYLSRGQASEADRVLLSVLRGSPDDELVERAGRSLVQLNLGGERLRALEQTLLPLALGNAQRPVYRSLLVELYEASARPWIETAREPGPAGDTARSELEALGKRAIKPLLEALADPDPAQNRIAIELLGQLRNPHAAIPLLRAAELEGGTLLRRRALLGAGSVASSALAPRFAALARAPERRLRDAAAWGLSRMSGPAVVAELRELSASSTPAVRGYALLGLGKLSDAASVETMRNALRGDRHAFARGSAALALGSMQDRASAGALSTALRTEQGEAALAAALALGMLGDRAAAEPLAEAVFTSDAALRGAALWSLRWLARDARPEEPALPQPNEPDQRLSLAPVTAAFLERTPPSHVGDALRVFEVELREAARAALYGAPATTRAALALLAGEEPALLPPGQSALPARLLEPLMPAVAELATHPDPTVRAGALALLASTDAATAAAPLLQALGDGDAEVQSTALAAIGNAVPGSPETLSRLCALAVSDARWWMRRRAVQALARTTATKATAAALQQALRADPYAYVREAAAEALGQLRVSSAVAAVSTALAQDPEPAVRAAARRALERIRAASTGRPVSPAGPARAPTP